MTVKSLSDMSEEQKPAVELPAGISAIEDGQIKLNLDYLRSCNIMFATPCYGGMVTDQYFLSMFKLSQVLLRYGIPFRISTLRNESLVPRARNILTAMFLEDKSCTHLMFIDADIEFEPESIIRMLALDRDITAGAYAKKTINWERVNEGAKQGVADVEPLGAEHAINLKFDDQGRVRAYMGLIEALDASTGFFMVKRNVFDKLIEAYPETKYVNDNPIDPKLNDYCYALFDSGIDEESRRYLSEDYYFCRLWQKIGGEVWVDPNTPLNHIGSYTFRSNLGNVLNLTQ